MKKCIIKGNSSSLKIENSNDKCSIIVEGDLEISDSYHTIDELYSHRILLFIALLKSNKYISWRSKHHSDGTFYEGWFIAGMNLPSGMITYHIDNRFWDMLNDIDTLEVAPIYDGHTSTDVLKRLNGWIISL